MPATTPVGTSVSIIIQQHSSIGPGHLKKTTLQLPVQAGRPDPAAPGIIPNLNLHPDFKTSRLHARLQLKESRWMIEDMESKRGTMLGDKEIKGRGLVEYIPGTPVKTGETTWAAFPRHWLLISHGELLIFGFCATTMNYATYHCGSKIIGPLHAWNLGPENSLPLELCLELDQYSDPCLIPVPSLEPGKKINLGLPPLRFYPERLKKQGTPQKCSLCISLNGKERPDLSKELLILGLWDWSFDPEARKTLAALVTPHEPAIERAVTKCQKELAALAPGHTIESLLRSDRDNAEVICLEALFNYLKKCEIKYVEPGLVDTTETPHHYQQVRSAEQVLPAGNTGGTATCLDLAIFFAGCLERIKLAPLVILIGPDAQNIEHAFVGCWTGFLPGSQALIEGTETLLREIAAGFMIVLESTATATGFNKKDPDKSFLEAIAEAENLISETPWACAVDILALRPPFGQITPLQHPFSPAVAGAVSSAWELSRSKKMESVELLHLLYGLLSARGEVTEIVFSKAGINTELLSKRLYSLLKGKDFTDEPAPTLNYTACLRQAGELAWQSESTYIQEQDLLWALLLQAPASKTFMENCSQAQLDLNKIGAMLEQYYPNPNLRISHRFNST